MEALGLHGQRLCCCGWEGMRAVVTDKQALLHRCCATPRHGPCAKAFDMLQQAAIAWHGGVAVAAAAIVIIDQHAVAAVNDTHTFVANGAFASQARSGAARLLLLPTSQYMSTSAHHVPQNTGVLMT
jgi:hypothetical protein